jgi:hypothetical protein
MISIMALVTGSAAASGPDVRVEVPELKFAVALPAACRHLTGPGTVEAVCAPDLDPSRRGDVQTAAAILLEVEAEEAPVDAPAYSETAFRQELPETVCGESDPARVTLSDVASVSDGARRIWSARVVCAPVPFLQLGERQAQARTIVAGPFRYRLTARWPTADADAARAVAERFLRSFETTAP